MAIDLGDTVRLTYQHRTAGGELVTPGSITLTIGLPDGTETVITPGAPSSPGLFEYEYTTMQPGRHTVRWVGTGPAGAFADVFDVRESTPRYLMSLADARTQLRLDGLTGDEELRSVVEAVTAPVEDMVGPVIVREVVEVQPGGRVLVLDRPPVLELTAVEPLLSGGLGYEVADLDLDPEPGVVRRLDGGVLVGPLRVTYTAGRRVVDAAILEAARVIVEHLWETRRGHGGARPGFGEDDLVPTPSGFLVPHRAAELLAPFRRPPVLA